MVTRRKPRVWGGSRPGAGRPPGETPLQPVPVYLPAEGVQALELLAETMSDGSSRGSLMRDIIMEWLEEVGLV